MYFELIFILITIFVDAQTTGRNDVICINNKCSLRYREWVIQCTGGLLNARFVADYMGLDLLSPLDGFPDTYVMRSKSPTTHKNWHKRIRVPRSANIMWMQEQIPLVRTKRKVSTNLVWNDPLYSEMWYLTRSSEGKGHDMKVQEAWKLGYTGKNVVVTIMDDGVDHTHPDLIANYDPKASFDVIENDWDPMPDLKNNENNKHGTRCAGQIAAQGNNSVCIVGIAYNARIGGIRMLDGSITDRIEAQTLSFRQDHIDIYSGSWGPEDTGKVYEGPGVLAQSAFQRGVITGRNGLGNIYVWASGNGGSSGDSCAADGYASSPFTLSVSGVGEHNRRPWYLEQCASTLATTYSSGAHSEKTIATVDTNHRCTTQHTGTSASAPMAAGIIALLLEANPRLSWRDVQYVTLLSANPEPFVDGNFTKNAVGRAYSQLYGYGLMDAEKMVRLGELWRGVPAHHHCTSKVGNVKRRLNGTFSYVFNLTFHGCQRDDRSNASSSSVSSLSSSRNVTETGEPVRYLEHVQVYADIYYYRRGLLQLTVISPSGTESIILPPRINDDHSGNIGLSRWPLTTVQFWGEMAAGVWQFRLDTRAGYSRFQTWQRPVLDNVEANWVSVWMVAYGTDEFPIRLKPPNPARPPPTEWFTDFSKYVVDDSKWHYVYTCHIECAPGGCTGPAADQCLGGCRHFATQSRQCVAKCPPGTTPFGALRISITQHSMWKIHKRDRDRAKSKWNNNSPLPGYDTVLSSRIRSSESQDPMYGLTDNVVCQPCWSLCAACVRPYTEYDCTACSNGRFLVPLITPEEGVNSDGTDSDLLLLSISDVPLPVVAGTCRTECPAGYYPNRTSSVCNRCIPHCMECVGPRIGECSLCKPGFRLVHGRCVDGNSIDGRCKPGEYLKLSRCVLCESSCDPTGCLPDGHCILCKPQYPYFMNGSCVSECPVGWFAGLREISPYAIVSNTNSRTPLRPQRCERCGPGCQKCTGFHECNQCATGLTVRNGRCVPTKSLPPVTNPKCATYFRSKNDCLTCPAEKHLSISSNADLYSESFLKQSDLRIASQSARNPSGSLIRRLPDPPYFGCVQTCPQGTYLTHTAQGETVCRPCPTACSTCSDETRCTSCNAPFYLDRVTTSCLFGQSCRQSEYFDHQQQTCVPCDSTCATCRGPLVSDCTSCSAHGSTPRCLNPIVNASTSSVARSAPSNSESSETPLRGRCVTCCAYKFALISHSPRDCMFCVADKATCLSGSDISAGAGLLVEELDTSGDSGSSWFSREPHLVLFVICLILLVGSLALVIRFMISSRKRRRGRHRGAGGTTHAVRRNHRKRFPTCHDCYPSSGEEEDDEGVHVSLKAHTDVERNTSGENGLTSKTVPISVGEYCEAPGSIRPLHPVNGDIGSGFNSGSINHTGMTRAFPSFEATSRRTPSTTNAYQPVLYSQLPTTLTDEELPEDEEDSEDYHDRSESFSTYDQKFMPACTTHALRDGEHCTREPPTLSYRRSDRTGIASKSNSRR